jgi:hypothetical protein
MVLVWHWFTDLNSSRSSNGFGINPISYSEMLAYFQLIDYKPYEWEIDAIKKLDQLMLTHFAKEQDKKANKHKVSKK